MILAHGGSEVRENYMVYYERRKRDTKERGNRPRPLVNRETVLTGSFRWAVTYTFSFIFGEFHVNLYIK